MQTTLDDIHFNESVAYHLSMLGTIVATLARVLHTIYNNKVTSVRYYSADRQSHAGHVPSFLTDLGVETCVGSSTGDFNPVPVQVRFIVENLCGGS